RTRLRDEQRAELVQHDLAVGHHRPARAARQPVQPARAGGGTPDARLAPGGQGKDAMTGTAMLEVTGLSHAFGAPGTGHLALDDITLMVTEGELVSIVGPSGCGKSTLLRCVAGLIRPTGGSVVLRGVAVVTVPDRLAVVFQDYSRSLFPWLSVRDNVALPLRRTQPSRAQRHATALEALAPGGLAGTAPQFPWRLSGGLQRGVATAGPLAGAPVLLLMDEPFGSVDAQTREDLEDLILAVRRDRLMTILMVTHDIDESVYVGDRVVVLTAGPGRVRADLRVDLPAPPDQIATKEPPPFLRPPT